MGEHDSLSEGQIALIRTLWELAQGRIDALYSTEGAEKEKQAVEQWMERIFPKEHDEWVRPKGIETTASLSPQGGGRVSELSAYGNDCPSGYCEV